MPKKQNTNLIKSIILLGLITLVFVFSGVVISAYPQHLYFNNNTVIDASVGNFNNSTVNIRGNQVPYSPGDIIFLEGQGRDYIKITGNQIQIDGGTYISGMRSLSSDLTQNVLFEQKIGNFTPDGACKIIIDDKVTNLIPVTENIINIRTSDSDYFIEFVNDFLYFKNNDIMFKLHMSGNNINVYIIGINNYNEIVFVKV